MKESKLFKQVADRQMPDLEAIRNACIEQKPQESKSKIIRFSTPKIISVAAICVILATGMIAVFANPGGVFTRSKTEVTVTETKVTKANIPTKAKSKNKNVSANSSYNLSSAANSVTEEKTKEEKLIKRLKENHIRVDTLSELGKVEGFSICYASDYTEEYSCDYIIGDYTFSATTQCVPYGLGIYVLDDDQCFLLDEAYSQDVFRKFAKVAELIENSDIGITVKRNDDDAESILEYFDTDTVFVANVGEVDDGKLLYRTDDDYSGETVTRIFGDYEFFCTDAQETYDLGFYFMKDGMVYTLADAIEQGKITDISKVVELINELKTKTAVKVFVTEKEEPTIDEESEEPTDDVNDD